MLGDKQRTTEDNIKKINYLTDLKRDNVTYCENIKITQTSVNNLSADIADLKRKHD